jgi:hypothetical protein
MKLKKIDKKTNKQTRKSLNNLEKKNNSKNTLNCS